MRNSINSQTGMVYPEDDLRFLEPDDQPACHLPSCLGGPLLPHTHVLTVPQPNLVSLLSQDLVLYCSCALWMSLELVGLAVPRNTVTPQPRIKACSVVAFVIAAKIACRLTKSPNDFCLQVSYRLRALQLHGKDVPVRRGLDLDRRPLPPRLFSHQRFLRPPPSPLPSL